MATPNEFNRRMGRVAARVLGRTDQVVRAAALAIDQAVVMATPVDTGRARSNWIVSLDEPSGEVREPLVAGSKGSSAAAVTMAATVEAAGVVAGYRGKFNTSITITNNLPYIKRLNEGWSAQAPAGFVEMGVQAGVRAVRGARLL